MHEHHLYTLLYLPERRHTPLVPAVAPTLLLLLLDSVHIEPTCGFKNNEYGHQNVYAIIVHACIDLFYLLRERTPKVPSANKRFLACGSPGN